jgi:hypothetical protein
MNMKKLNTEEIKQFADALLFTESEARDITDLFYNLKMENPINNWRVLLPLNDVDEYIREWENHWHRENNFTECFEYEKENEFDEYEYETAKQIFASEGAFRKYAMEKETQFVYQLPNNDMVVVVC